MSDSLHGGQGDHGGTATVDTYAVVPVANSMASFLVVVALVVLIGLLGMARLVAQWVALNILSPRSIARRLVRQLHNHPYLGDLLVAVTVYLPTVLVLALCYHYDYDAAINRFAWVGLAHFFVSTLLGIHFSPFAALLPRARLLLLHKWTSRLGALFVVTHMSIHLTNWIQWDFVQEQLQRSSMQFGLASFVLLSVLVLASLYPVRMLFYATFAGVHNLLVLMLSAFIFMHARDTLVLVLPLLAIFMLNKLLIAMQLVRPAHFTITQVVDPPPAVKHCGGSVVRVDIAAPHLTNVRPEQQVYMGAKPISTLHPFTPRAVSATSLLALHPTHASAAASSAAAQGTNPHLIYRPYRPSPHPHHLAHHGSNTDLTSTTSLTSLPSTLSLPIDPPPPLPAARAAPSPSPPSTPSTSLLLGTASADHPPTLTLLVRHSPLSGFTTMRLRPGMAGAAHRLVAFVPPWAPALPLPRFRSVVFIAGGIGITPVLTWLDRLAKIKADAAAGAAGKKNKRGSASSRSMTLDRSDMMVDGEPGSEGGRRQVPEVVHIVWVVSREDELRMAPELAMDDGAAVRTRVGGVASVRVVVTGSGGRQRAPAAAEADRREGIRPTGRPRMDEVVPRMDEVKGPVMGFVVGPQSLVEDVRQLNRDWWLHVEPFAW